MAKTIVAVSLINDINELKEMLENNPGNLEDILINDEIESATEYARKIKNKRRYRKDEKTTKKALAKAIKKNFGFIKRRGDSRPINLHRCNMYDGKTIQQRRKKTIDCFDEIDIAI